MRGSVLLRVRDAIVAGLVGVLVLGSPGQTQAQGVPTEVLAARLDGLAAGFMATEQVPGAIAAVVTRDGVILRGWGHADLDAGIPAGPDTARFEIGSITKLFTWLAVMMLLEEGRLDLQADVSDYLRDMAVPGTEPLTMAHLMSHRSGYAESYGLFDPAISALPRPQALAASAPAQVFPRGQVTAYSNWGVALAGQIVEDVAGIPYEVFLQTRILDPLGMPATTFSEAARRPDQPPLSRSYRVQGGVHHPAYRVEIGSFGPAGSVASTAADMARFLRFLLGDGSLDGVRLLQPDTMARMRTRLFDDRPLAADMAHGFQSRPLFGTMVYGHGGGLNEFLSHLVFIPEIGAGVFISQNGGTGLSLPYLAPDMILAVLAAEGGLVAPPPSPVPDARARAAEAAGRYLSNRRAFSGPAQVLAALAPLTVAPTADGALLLPTATLQAFSRFEPIAPDLWQDPLGDRLWMIRDAEGRIVRLADGTGTQTHERVQGLDDPVWLLAGLGLATLLAMTTLLGLLWRRGLKGGSRMGTAAAWVALTGAVLVWAMLGSAVAMGIAAAQLGSEFLFDQPQPTAAVFLTLADALAVLSALMVIALVFVWRAPDWSMGRRLHQTAFAFALAVLAGLMVRWGLAFGGPIW
jgi:CubicO group peptidase (beta-lactamase class C family)